VTDEEVEVVDKWVASRKKTGYPIAILGGELEEFLGVPHFPFSGVLDPEGKIAYAGDSPESALKKALKAAKPGSIWPKRLLPSAALLRTGKTGEAWATLQELRAAGGLDDAEQKTLDRFSVHVTAASADAVKAANELFKKDLLYLALQRLEPIAASKPPLPSAEEAKKLLEEIRAVPAIDAELKGGEVYAAGLAKEEEREFLDAVLAYKDVAKKFAGTRIAGAAQKRAEHLVGRGMPGYQKACEKCQEAKKACEKHAKTVKL